VSPARSKSRSIRVHSFSGGEREKKAFRPARFYRHATPLEFGDVRSPAHSRGPSLSLAHPCAVRRAHLRFWIADWRMGERVVGLMDLLDCPLKASRCSRAESIPENERALASYRSNARPAPFARAQSGGQPSKNQAGRFTFANVAVAGAMPKPAEISHILV